MQHYVTEIYQFWYEFNSVISSFTNGSNVVYYSAQVNMLFSCKIAVYFKTSWTRPGQFFPMLSIHLNVLFCHDFIILILILIKLWLLLQFWIKIINFTIRHVDNTSMISDYRTKWQQKQNDPTAWWLTGLGALVCLLQMLWKGVKHDDKHYDCSSPSASFPDSVWFMSM